MDLPSSIKNIFSQPTLLVKVGPEKREYHIHQFLATKHSRYFRDVTSKPSVESVTLRDVDPATFEDYVHWLYRQQLPTNQGQSLCWNMATLYAFADRFSIPALKNAIVHEFTRVASSQIVILRYSTIIFAFKKLPKDSPFLQLLSDIHCKYWTEDIPDEEGLSEQLPHEFLLQVMRKYAMLKKSKRFDIQLNPANYIEKRNRDSISAGKMAQIGEQAS